MACKVTSNTTTRKPGKSGSPMTIKKVTQKCSSNSEDLTEEEEESQEQAEEEADKGEEIKFPQSDEERTKDKEEILEQLSRWRVLAGNE